MPTVQSFITNDYSVGQDGRTIVLTMAFPDKEQVQKFAFRR